MGSHRSTPPDYPNLAISKPLFFKQRATAAIQARQREGERERERKREKRMADVEERVTLLEQALDACFLLVCSIFVFRE